MVSALMPGGAAEACGLKQGDVVEARVGYCGPINPWQSARQRFPLESQLLSGSRRIPARGWWMQRDTPNVTKCHEQQKEKGEKGAHRQRAHRQRGWKLGGHQAAPVGKAVKTHINALALPQKVMANVLKLASPRGPDPTITYVM